MNQETMKPELLIEVSRDEITEVRHYGHIAITDRNGKIIFSRGNPNYMTFFRSELPGNFCKIKPDDFD